MECFYLRISSKYHQEATAFTSTKICGGACSPDFKAAGGHFNPAGKGHGINHPKGSHGGDMPNIHAAADGSVKAEVLNVKVTLGSGGNSVFDSDGSAIVIHAKPDTYGAKAGAGERIACGVIRK